MSFPYNVYRLRFTTGAGSKREYYGYSRWLNLREGFHRSKPTPFAKPALQTTFEIETVEGNISSKGAALTVEALLAARAIVRAPGLCRGGPWSSPRPLDATVLAEIKEVAACRSLMTVHAIAARRLGGPLWRHLRNLRFASASEVPAGTPVTRGACVTKVKKSGKSGGPGTCGNDCRKAQLDAGTLTRGSAKHKRLHRGKDPVARRRAETGRRMEGTLEKSNPV